MSRRSARETAMKLLYQYSITGELSAQGIEDAPDALGADQLDDEDRTYVGKIVAGFEIKREEIDGIITEHSHSWRIDRISKVDLAILRLSLFEMRALEVPSKVSVNEAVELAKKYSADKSYKYINGLLGGYLKSE